MPEGENCKLDCNYGNGGEAWWGQGSTSKGLASVGRAVRVSWPYLDCDGEFAKRQMDNCLAWMANLVIVCSFRGNATVLVCREYGGMTQLSGHDDDCVPLMMTMLDFFACPCVPSTTE